jgi:hypothetical protein
LANDCAFTIAIVDGKESVFLRAGTVLYLPRSVGATAQMKAMSDN